MAGKNFFGSVINAGKSDRYGNEINDIKRHNCHYFQKYSMFQNMQRYIGCIAYFVNNGTGLIENNYKGNKTSIVLQTEEILKIERQNVTVSLERRKDRSFQVESYKTK